MLLGDQRPTVSRCSPIGGHIEAQLSTVHADAGPGAECHRGFGAGATAAPRGPDEGLVHRKQLYLRQQLARAGAGTGSRDGGTGPPRNRAGHRGRRHPAAALGGRSGAGRHTPVTLGLRRAAGAKHPRRDAGRRAADHHRPEPAVLALRAPLRWRDSESRRQDGAAADLGPTRRGPELRRAGSRVLHHWQGARGRRGSSRARVAAGPGRAR